MIRMEDLHYLLMQAEYYLLTDDERRSNCIL